MKLRKFKVIVPIEVEVWALSEEDAKQMGNTLSYESIENMQSCRGNAYISFRDDGQVLSIEPRKGIDKLLFPHAEIPDE